jgi:RNA polymerase sigma-70 factor (ECF subfamily)
VAQPVPEVDLVRRAQRGDAAAFSMLVRRHETRVFNFVVRLVGDRTLAEDLTQEVFLRVFQRLPTFSFGCKFTTWLFQVAKNRVLDELRDRERRPCQVTLDDLPPLEAMDAPLEQRELAAALWRAIEGLPSDLQMALVLRDVVGLSYSEIAEALEIRLSTVKWRIFAAREEVVLVLSRAETLSASPGLLGRVLPRL